MSRKRLILQLVVVLIAIGAFFIFRWYWDSPVTDDTIYKEQKKELKESLKEEKAILNNAKIKASEIDTLNRAGLRDATRDLLR